MKIIAAAVAALLLAACSGGHVDGPGAAPATTPPATSPTTSVTTSASPSVPPGCTPAFVADTTVDRATPVGGVLGMKAARAAGQSGYDRVVFELAGSGQPGWEAGYVDVPRSDGSGQPVPVHGSAFLRVIVRAVGLPGDTGVPEPAPSRFTPAGTTVVKEVTLDHVFEGQYTAFIGLSGTLPFRVTRLAGPPRVVVDVRRC